MIDHSPISELARNRVVAALALATRRAPLASLEERIKAAREMLSSMTNEQLLSETVVENYALGRMGL